ncbi:hypothetical protein BDN70DRAFT_824365 [Pholiota conissans]|uniref:Methyltransferase ausD n=1 Tax=Pholiota conissans TaxID=109636 RepID=A0A9P5ZEI5_9AGAR|nr:hypothetical protein BDN70DRAFT_824365 [Pholiota conissans]
MSTANYFDNPQLRPKLDPSFYHLDADELAFFKTLTGISDEQDLKSHIISVQAKAYEVYGYPCIRSFHFTKLKIAGIDPGYKQALQLLQERKNPIFLELGCCFGNDVRKAVLDGWRIENVIASDLRQGFWDYGHDLFKSTPESFPVAFVAGDAFDAAMIKPRGPFITDEDISSLSSDVTPPLKELRSLTPLQGKVSAIHASALFHLFSEKKQLELARQVASLLSPEKGSVIFGQHAAQPVKGTQFIVRPKVGDDGKQVAPGVEMFCHSPESWKQMWIEQVFNDPDSRGSERIKVESRLVEFERPDVKAIVEASNGAVRFWVMNWCITRL